MNELQESMRTVADAHKDHGALGTSEFRESGLKWAQHSLVTYNGNLLLKALAISAAIAEFENELEKPT